MKNRRFYIILPVFIFFNFYLSAGDLVRSVHNLAPNLNFYSTIETLGKIEEIIKSEKKGVYLRFGDGDLYLADGKGDKYQNVSKGISLEMKQALSLNGVNVIKSLPLHCKEIGTSEDGMFIGNHDQGIERIIYLLKTAKRFWGSEINDVYSPVALHFASTNYVEYCIEFLKVIKSKSCILVGNKNIPARIRNLLFGKDCIFVPTPAKNAYSKMNEVEKACLKFASDNRQYKVIVTSMGCSGRILQRRLWEKLNNVFLFDFGSLMDALCGWQTRTWIRVNEFDENHFLSCFEDI